jgi:hypothetical protein
MNGFEGRTWDLSDDCLSETFQSKLDEDLVQFLYSLVRADFEDAFTYLNTFFNDLGTQNKACGFHQIAESINYLVSHGSVFTLFRNIASNFFDIVAATIDCVGALVIEEW